MELFVLMMIMSWIAAMITSNPVHIGIFATLLTVIILCDFKKEK